MLVSIIMPVYNGEKTILGAINSVLDQTYENWELVIVDDCSKDQTYSVVKSVDDERIKFYQLDSNTGSPTSPRNFGLSVCNGQYVSFLDADDLWEPKKLELQVAVLERGYNIVCSNYSVFVDENWEAPISYRQFPKEFNFRKMLRGNCIGNLTGIYNRDKLGIVPQKHQGHEDYIMWLELVKKGGNVYCVQEPLARYRLSSSSVSSDKLRAAKWQWRIYREELELNALVSSYYFSQYALNVVRRNFFKFL